MADNFPDLRGLTRRGTQATAEVLSSIPVLARYLQVPMNKIGVQRVYIKVEDPDDSDLMDSISTRF